MNLRATSLSGQLTRTIVLWVCGFWFTGALAVAWYLDSEVTQTLDSSLVQSANRLLELAAHELDEVRGHGQVVGQVASPTTPHHQEESVHDVQGDYLMYQVLDAAGALLMRSVDAPDKPLAVPLQPGFSQTADWRIYTLVHPVQALYIRVADPLLQRQTTRQRSLLILLLPLLVVLPVLAWVVGYVVRRRMVAVNAVTTQVGERGGRDLSPVNTQSLPDELGDLVDNVNRLLTRLQEALQTERALSANAAHELRTPLTVAQLRLSNALMHDLPEAARVEVVSADKALKQLTRRTEKLLQLSRAESGAALARDPVHLNQVVAAVVAEFASDPQAQQRLQVAFCAQVWVQGDFDAIAIVLRNLIENSLRYSAGSTVEVVLTAPNQLTVRDGGAGVSPAQLADLAHRHVRFSHNVAGFGLGLSIVKTIMERHEGHLCFHSPPEGFEGGFEVCLVFLPCSDPTHSP
jgi:two-component system, OmpR family, sensor kinase